MMFPAQGATWDDDGVLLDAVGEIMISHFYTDTKVDITRDIIITIVWERGENNNDTVDALFYLASIPMNDAATVIENNTAISLAACVQGYRQKYQYTLDSSDVVTDSDYRLFFTLNEAARTLYVSSVTVRYYIKREV